MAQQRQINRIIELGVAQANINARDMNLAIAALAQEAARARVAASAPAALTDNSTGTAEADYALAAVVTPTIAAQDGVVELAPKTGFDTAIGLVENAHEELGAKINEFIALIAPGAADVSAYALAAGSDGTVDALTTALVATTAADDGVEASSGITQINTARNNQAALASALNWCRVAMGLAPATDNSGGQFEKSTSADWPSTDAAATGVAAPAGENSLTDATVDAALVALANNVASMAAALNEMRGTLAIGPFVVATHNPSWKFQAGDTTV